MILFGFIVVMIFIGVALIAYANNLEKHADQVSCYDVRSVKGAVRGENGMFVSESMLSNRRSKVNRKNSKF